MSLVIETTLKILNIYFLFYTILNLNPKSPPVNYNPK